MTGAQCVNVHGQGSCFFASFAFLHTSLAPKFKLMHGLAPPKLPTAAHSVHIALDERRARSPSYLAIVQTSHAERHRMGQLQELEQRISAAFARISAGVVTLSAPEPAPAVATPDADDLTHLTNALDEERMANAQLHERLRHLQEQAASAAAAHAAEVDTLTRHLDAQGLDTQRLSSTVAQLREDLRRLREAAEQGIVDPALINRAMMAELEALRTTRAAESTEMADILSALGHVLDAEEARPHA